MRRLLTVSVLAATTLVALLGVYIGILTTEIHRQSTLEEARPADVIVILGAAAYRGRPSPILKARLDHGLFLYHHRYASRILTTGGAGGDPDFTESEVGRNYLIRHGVPSEAIILEPEGNSTVYSTAAVGEIMRRMNLTSCVVVSDGYHIFRVKKLLEDRGVRVFGSPRPAPSQDDWHHWRLCVRQAIGYMLWQAGIRI